MAKLVSSNQLAIPVRQTFSNANVTGLFDTTCLAQVGVLSAPVVVTLPSANAARAGQILIIGDESATCSPINTIAIARAGTDTIDGVSAPCVLNSANQSISLASDGISKWSVVASQSMIFDFIASNAAFVIPNGYTALRIHGISAGAGGGSGRRDANLVSKSGGGGGASGCYATIDYSIANIGGAGTVLVVSIGAGGNGGAGQTVDATNGNNGGGGGNTTVMASSIFLMNAVSLSNGYGVGGSATAGAGGAAGSTAIQQFPNPVAGSGSATSASSAAGSASTPGGGGGGGGSNASNTLSSVGGGGNGARAFTANNGGLQGTGGANGTNGGGGIVNASSIFGGGGGGGGGGNAGTGGIGGDGIRGGGGGGGGASLNGNVSGAGGNGGDGFLRLIFI